MTTLNGQNMIFPLKILEENEGSSKLFHAHPSACTLTRFAHPREHACGLRRVAMCAISVALAVLHSQLVSHRSRERAEGLQRTCKWMGSGCSSWSASPSPSRWERSRSVTPTAPSPSLGEGTHSLPAWEAGAAPTEGVTVLTQRRGRGVNTNCIAFGKLLELLSGSLEINWTNQKRQFKFLNENQFKPFVLKGLCIAPFAQYTFYSKALKV